MTPSLRGRSAAIEPGVLPIIRFASAPTAKTRSSLLSIATTDGSLSTMPCPRTATNVFAVPKSIAKSPSYCPNNESSKDIVFPNEQTLTYTSLNEMSFELVQARF